MRRTLPTAATVVGPLAISLRCLVHERNPLT